MLTFLSAQTFAGDCENGKCVIRSNKPVATITSKVTKPVKVLTSKVYKTCKYLVRR